MFPVFLQYKMPSPGLKKKQAIRDITVFSLICLELKIFFTSAITKAVL